MKSKTLLIAVILCISGCASVLQSKPAEVAALTQNQGAIVGSIILKLKEESPMFPDALSDKKWQLYVISDKFDPSADRVLDIKPDGKEIPFVSILTPGIYLIEELRTTGFNSQDYRLPLKLKFSVEDKKKTYIGRLVITMPSHVNVFKGIFFADKNVSIAVEDAQTDTMPLLSGEYGTSLVEGLQKGLMGR